MRKSPAIAGLFRQTVVSHTGHCYFSGQATYPSAFHAKGGGADVEESIAGSPAGSDLAARAFHKSVLTTRRQSNGQLISSI